MPQDIKTLLAEVERDQEELPAPCSNVTGSVMLQYLRGERQRSHPR